MRSIRIATFWIMLWQAWSFVGAQNYTQGFETGDNWNIVLGADSISSNTGASYTPANATIRNGTHFWKVQNILDTLRLSDVNISGTGYKVNIYLGSISTTATNGADSTDTVKVYTILNGVMPAQPDIIIRGALNARWGYNANLVASTTSGIPATFTSPQNGTSTNNYGKIEINIPNGTNTVGLMIVGKNNNVAEIWAIDDISLSSSCTPPPPPTTAAIGFICPNTPVSLNASGNDPTWFDVPSGGNSVHVGSPFIVSLFVTDTFWVESSLNGCTSSRTMVVVNILPPVIVSGPNTVCTNQVISYFATTASTWMVFGGTEGVDFVTLQGPNLSIQFLTPNTYTLQAMSTDGCVGMWSVLAQPCGCQAYMSGNIDSTGVGTFVAQNNFGTGTTYEWVWGDGTTSTSGPTPTHTFTQSGTYNVCLYISSPTCADTICQTYHALAYKTISGNVYFDANNNGTKDTGENPISHATVIASDGISNYYGLSNVLGNYTIYVPGNVNGGYQVFMQPNSNFNISEPTTQSYNLPGSISHTNKNFGLASNQNMTEVSITSWAGPARPGFTNYMVLQICNHGTVSVQDSVSLNIPATFTFVSAQPTPTTTSGQNLTWAYHLEPFECKTIAINYSIPISTPIGSVHSFISQIQPNPDYDPTNNTFTLPVVVIASYDPNDKISNLSTTLEAGPDSYIDYTIRFQNVGTDTAFLVQVFDTLDTHLDVNSFKMLASSHDGTVDILGGKIIRWTFQGILLPPASINDAASSGYVHFKIKYKNGLLPPFQIQNTAAIYFDYNPPVITNTLTHSFIITGLEDLASASIHIYPNPFSRAIQIDWKDSSPLVFELFDLQGKSVWKQEFNQPATLTPECASGLYIYQIKQNGKIFTGKLIKE